MSRRRKEALRPLTPEEQELLLEMSRSRRIPAIQSRRAALLLRVAEGKSLLEAARSQGYVDGDTVSHLVTRFNQEGMEALTPRHLGGPEVKYQLAEQNQILELARTPPTAEEHGTNSWSLSTLKDHLRKNGLPEISTHTIWKVLSQSGMSWQRSRSWCDTGQAQRIRKAGTVKVKDPDSEAKKS